MLAKWLIFIKYGRARGDRAAYIIVSAQILGSSTHPAREKSSELHAQLTDLALGKTLRVLYSDFD